MGEEAAMVAVVERSSTGCGGERERERENQPERNGERPRSRERGSLREKWTRERGTETCEAERKKLVNSVNPSCGLLSPFGCY